MPPPNRRSLPTLLDLRLLKNELVKGQRIIVNAAAGPGMAGRHGVVRGSSGTRHLVRVLLAGSQNEMTLHSRFLDVENEPGRDP